MERINDIGARRRKPEIADSTGVDCLPAAFVGVRAVVQSERMRQVMLLAKRFGQSGVSVLIQGESGSGKELVARAIHQFSGRANRPWVDVNCGALPEHLVESELFGFEKGAFSGAEAGKPGLFELADKGTLFLDEVGELPPAVQVKLLRVLDGASYYRLGGTRKVSVDVRVITATNLNLHVAVSAGRFRADLFHRIAQAEIAVPPLRERNDDILPLAYFFLQQHNERLRLAPDATDCLRQHMWPGNVRELRNVVIRAALLCNRDEIRACDLPIDLAQSKPAPAKISPCATSLSLEELESQAIGRALADTRGNQRRAAALLGISERTLSRKLKQARATASDCASPSVNETDERRREPREQVAGDVRLYLLGTPGYGFPAHLRDVSSGGFRVTHKNFSLRAGDEVMTDASLGGHTARVMWTRIGKETVDSGMLFVTDQVGASVHGLSS